MHSKPNSKTNGHQPPPVDPALADNLAELTALAGEIGAEGVVVLRGARDAQVTYTAPDLPGVSLDVADGGLYVLLRFPASDGGAPGIERR